MRTAWISSIIFSFVGVIGVGVFSFFLISGKSNTNVGRPQVIRAPLQISFDDSAGAETVTGDSRGVENSDLKTAPLNVQAEPMQPIELPVEIPNRLSIRLPVRQAQLDQIDNSSSTTVVESIVAGSQTELKTKNRDIESAKNNTKFEQNSPTGSIPARSDQAQTSKKRLNGAVIVDDFLAVESAESEAPLVKQAKSNTGTGLAVSNNLALRSPSEDVIDAQQAQQNRQAKPVDFHAKFVDSPKSTARAKNKVVPKRNDTAGSAQKSIAPQPEVRAGLDSANVVKLSPTDNDQDIAAFKTSVATLRVMNQDIRTKKDTATVSITDGDVAVSKEMLNKSSADSLGNFDKEPDNSIAIIVNRANAESISIDDIKNIYFDKILRWENGEKITLYNLPLNSLGRAVFSRKVLNMSAIQAATEESNRVITNAALNQSQTKRERLVLSYVARNPQAIGYVPFNEAKGNDNVRIIMTMH